MVDCHSGIFDSVTSMRETFMLYNYFKFDYMQCYAQTEGVQHV